MVSISINKTNASIQEESCVFPLPRQVNRRRRTTGESKGIDGLKVEQELSGRSGEEG